MSASCFELPRAEHELIVTKVAQHISSGAVLDDELSQLVWQAAKPGLAARGCVRFQLINEPERVPVSRYEAILISLSRSLGCMVPQNAKRDLVVHVQDENRDYRLPCTRGHQTNAELAFHSDRCDINLLLYVSTGESGGEISVIEYGHAAARLRERDQRAFKTLFEGLPFDLREERIFPSIAWHWRPVLWEYNGLVRGHYIRRFIVDSQRHSDCPRLSSTQLHAIDALDETLEELRPSHSFAPRPGEVVVLDNYRVLHARSSYRDGALPQRQRLALRTWVAPYESEELPIALHPLAGACCAGSYRGGVGHTDAERSVLGEAVVDIQSKRSQEKMI